MARAPSVRSARACETGRRAFVNRDFLAPHAQRHEGGARPASPCRHDPAAHTCCLPSTVPRRQQPEHTARAGRVSQPVRQARMNGPKWGRSACACARVRAAWVRGRCARPGSSVRSRWAHSSTSPTVWKQPCAKSSQEVQNNRPRGGGRQHNGSTTEHALRAVSPPRRQRPAGRCGSAATRRLHKSEAAHRGRAQRAPPAARARARGERATSNSARLPPACPRGGSLPPQ